MDKGVIMKLNLKTTNKEQEIIKEYLENSVSIELAEKINNGVSIEKENKSLINKKDLDGFMNYACEEARKQAEKGATSACISHEVVFGWAIHYFEEDSIIGTLYNQDGTAYKPTPKPTTTSTTFKPPMPKIKPQISLFEFMDNPTTTVEDNGITVDTETGEVLEEDDFEKDLETAKSIDKEVMLKLYELLDGQITVV